MFYTNTMANKTSRLMEVQGEARNVQLDMPIDSRHKQTDLSSELSLSESKTKDVRISSQKILSEREQKASTLLEVKRPDSRSKARESHFGDSSDKHTESSKIFSSLPSENSKNERSNNQKFLSGREMRPSTSLEDINQASLEKLSAFKGVENKGSRTRYIETTSKGNIYVGKSNLGIKVFNANITQLNVEVIVNAANMHLKHIGGVAAAIDKAAGRKLTVECEDFIKKHKSLEVTDVFVSSGGNLKAKNVLHAVGPKWDNYQDKDKWKCLQYLRQTVLRCMLEASCLKASRIALPSISAAVFKVPPQLCARSYLAAVKSFDCIREQLHLLSLQEVLFVDVNDDLVNQIQECFFVEWEEKADKHQVKDDLIFAKHHLDKREHTEPSYSQYSSSKSKENKHDLFFSPKAIGSKTSEKGTTFMFNKLQIRVSVEPAISSRSMTVIVIGAPFKHLSTLPDFSVEKCFHVDNGVTLYNRNVFKTYRSVLHRKQSGRICCLECDLTTNVNLEKGFKNLSSIDLSLLYEKEDNAIVITSKILYHEKRSPDRKLVGAFADLLYKYIHQVSKDNLKLMRIATSEEALPFIIRVFESRGDLTKLDKVVDFRKSEERYHKRNQSTYDHNEKRGTKSEPLSLSTQHSAYTTYSPPSYSRDDFTSNNSDPESQGESSVDAKNECPLCCDEKPSIPLTCCKSEICVTCFEKIHACPFCRKIIKLMKGNQPDGEMSVRYLHHEHAAGFEGYGVWEITYRFTSGVQKKNHPNPGKFYSFLTRIAFLPDTHEGYHALLLLKVSFMRCLTFTIGHSLTMNMDDKITWNDIHHKTSLRGGSFSYPDPQYLNRVTQELTDKGVTMESLTSIEKKELKKFEEDLKYQKKILYSNLLV